MGGRSATKDARGTLIFEFAKWASHPAVDFFLFENVPDLKKIDDGAVFFNLCKAFELANFKIKFAILNAADFGAATSRKRLFIIGWRQLPELFFPVPTHAKEPDLLQSHLLKWVPVMQVIRDLVDPGTLGIIPNHIAVNHSNEVSNRFAKTKPGGYDNIRKRSRLHPDRPSPSLVAGNLGGTRNHIHPTLPRELTNREIARIQGFPDDYVLSGNAIEVAKQVTNAVPIALGAALAKSILECISPIQVSNPANYL